MKPILHYVLGLCASFGFVVATHAQGRLVSAQGLHPIVGCYSNTDVAATAPGAQWQTWPTGGIMPANTASSAGRNDAGFLYIDAGAFVLYNLSARATVTGSFTSYGQINMTSQVMIGGTGNVRITIWGPTLDQFGVHGARDFTWQVRDAYTGQVYASGTGETSTPVTVSTTGSQVVVVNPGPYENGDVLVSYDF